MLTKLSLVVLLLCLSAPCFAQTPRIDSITVDEDKGELVLHGLFTNSSQAVVTVDSVSLPITLAYDTLIRATIPVSGKGSAGWVKLTISGKESNQKLITYFHFWVYHQYNSPHNQSGWSNADTIHLRGDFITTHSGHLYLVCSKISRFFHRVYCNGVKVEDSSGIFNVAIDCQIVLFNYDLKDRYCNFPDASPDVQFDDNYQIFLRSVSSANCYPPEPGCDGYGPLAPTDFPPPRAGVHQTPLTPNILQTRLSSDPVAAKAEAIITLRENMKVRMEIMDILGNVRSSEDKMLFEGDNRLSLNASSLAAGVYICRMQAGGDVVSLRFVKE